MPPLPHPPLLRHRTAIRVALVMAFCASTCAALPAPAGDPVARVGDTAIATRDIELRQRVEAAYAGGTAPSSTATLAMLINDALVHEVARRHGVLPTDADIDRLADHADTTSRDPKLLERIKRAFDGDLIAYRRLYLAPRITANMLREWFGQNRTLVATDTAATSVAAALPYEDWFRTAAASAPITIRADFLSDLQRLHSGLWWLTLARPAPPAAP